MYRYLRPLFNGLVVRASGRMSANGLPMTLPDLVQFKGLQKLEAISQHSSFSTKAAKFSSGGLVPNEMDEDTANLERQEAIAFDETFQRITKDLAAGRSNSEVAEAFRWIDKVVHFNVPHGKRNRGLAVVMAYRLLALPEDQTPENLELVRILGWCVELLQAFFLINDDIMDQSITRRGELCWYRQDGVGLMAINDAILIEGAMYQLLEMHFTGKPYYVNLLNLMHSVTRKTAYGQCLDLLSAPPGRKPDFSVFTLDRHAAIVKYKTAYYSFSLPVRLAMYMAGWNNAQAHLNAETILLKMGQFFQVQDDYLDCFGDPNVIGKIGTDIEDGKCSWPFVVARQRATPEMRRTLQENYGIHHTDAVLRVKDIYKQLEIEKIFHDYEEDSYQEICSLIEDLTRSAQLPSNIFYGFLAKIYRRIK